MDPGYGYQSPKAPKASKPKALKTIKAPKLSEEGSSQASASSYSRAPAKRRKKSTTDRARAPSGAFLHSIEVNYIRFLCDTILDQVNRSTSATIDWRSISDNLQLKCPSDQVQWSPIVCQKIWRYLAYGQVFSSTGEVKTSVFHLLTSQDNFDLPESDEEQFTTSPEDLSQGSCCLT